MIMNIVILVIQAMIIKNKKNTNTITNLRDNKNNNRDYKNINNHDDNSNNKN